MSSPADIIYQLLADLGLGTADGEWPMHVALFPDEPHKAICIYDTIPKRDGRMMRTGEQIEHPGIQIQVRGTEYSETYDKARNIALALDGVRKVSVAVSSDEIYIVDNVSRSGGILPMGTDDVGDRHYFAINATLTAKESE